MTSRLPPNYSANSFAGRRIRLVNLLSAGTISLCFLFLFGGCGEQSDGLDERVTQLQRELDRTQGELQTTTQALEASKEELARLKANASSTELEAASPMPSTSTIPSREDLEASYMAEAKTLKKQLQSQLKDFTLGSFTLHNVQLPDNQFPITSWISLAFQASDGKQWRLDFAVRADSKGTWVFPEAAEIVRRAAEVKKNGVTADNSTSRPQKTAPSETQLNVPTTMPSSNTVVIQWPNSTSPSASQDTAKNPDPAAKPNAQAPRGPQTTPAPSPKQTLPADRDVLIRF